jgi:hypothetical protein
MENIKFEAKNKTPELLARELEHYIRNYIPNDWVVPIHDVAYCPDVMSDDFVKLEKAYSSGDLVKFMEIFENGRYKQWYYIAAIKDFFEKNKK